MLRGREGQRKERLRERARETQTNTDTDTQTHRVGDSEQERERERDGIWIIRFTRLHSYMHDQIQTCYEGSDTWEQVNYSVEQAVLV
jgi:hypothetical protein